MQKGPGVRRLFTSRFLALSTVLGALLGAACNGQLVTTAETSGGPGSAGGSGKGAAGTSGQGQSGATGGPAGAGGTNGVGVVDPLPGDSSTKLTERPGRPHALQIHDRTLYWLRSTGAAEPAGVLERMSVEGGTVDFAFPASSLVRSFALRDGEIFVGGAKGGVVSYVDDVTKLRSRWSDDVVAAQLVVGQSSMLRVRANPAPGEPAVQGCNQHSPYRCDEQNLPWFPSAIDFPDLQIGTVRYDDQLPYISLRTSEAGASGIRRGVLLVAAGSDDPFVVVGDRLVRVWQRDANGLIVVDAPPRTTGQPRALFTRTAAALSLPAALGGALYFAEQQATGVPWRLLRASLQGGEPTVLSPALCGADPQTPELVASTDAVFVACPGDGTVKRVALSP